MLPQRSSVEHRRGPTTATSQAVRHFHCEPKNRGKEPKGKQMTHAEVRDVTDTAGTLWWGAFLQTNAQHVNRRFKQVGSVYWGPSERMPLDLFSFIREASLCFSVARFLAAIGLSSNAVEVILNKDTRMHSHSGLRRTAGWATLRNDNLKVAAAEGLPAHALLSPGESLDDPEPISFVDRRNKVAHGDIAPILQDLADYDPRAEAEAFDQVTKAQRFVVEWFNAAPDVQEGRIVNHRWP